MKFGFAIMLLKLSQFTDISHSLSRVQMRSFNRLAYAANVLSSAKLKGSHFFKNNRKSFKKILKKMGPKIDP